MYSFYLKFKSLWPYFWSNFKLPISTNGTVKCPLISSPFRYRSYNYTQDAEQQNLSVHVKTWPHFQGHQDHINFIYPKCFTWGRRCHSLCGCYIQTLFKNTLYSQQCPWALARLPAFTFTCLHHRSTRDCLALLCYYQNRTLILRIFNLVSR